MPAKHKSAPTTIVSGQINYGFCSQLRLGLKLELGFRVRVSIFQTFMWR